MPPPGHIRALLALVAAIWALLWGSRLIRRGPSAGGRRPGGGPLPASAGPLPASAFAECLVPVDYYAELARGGSVESSPTLNRLLGRLACEGRDNVLEAILAQAPGPWEFDFPDPERLSARMRAYVKGARGPGPRPEGAALAPAPPGAGPATTLAAAAAIPS
jgi:hypothetical protein